MSLFAGRGWRDPLLTASAVAAMVATTTGAGLRPPIEPSIPHDFADPTVLAVDGTYYAYSTASRYGDENFHVPVQRSRRLTGGWSHARDALPELPGWVDKTAVQAGNIWAPAVTERGHDGYLLYFAAPSTTQHTECIGVARAWAPEGPFQPTGSHPLVCQPGDADDIDPKPFTDTEGTHYLLYSASREGNATIWLQQLDDDGTRTIGDRRAVIRADRADEDHVVEAPAIVRHGCRYVLFYSANAYNGGHYFTNYATADSLGDEFVKHRGQFLNQDTLGDEYQNPGGQDVLHTHRHDFLVFHAYTTLTRRAMFVAGLGWNDHDHPELVRLDDGPERHHHIEQERLGLSATMTSPTAAHATSSVSSMVEGGP